MFQCAVPRLVAPISKGCTWLTWGFRLAFSVIITLACHLGSPALSGARSLFTILLSSVCRTGDLSNYYSTQSLAKFSYVLVSNLIEYNHFRQICFSPFNTFIIWFISEVSLRFSVQTILFSSDRKQCPGT